MKRSAEEIRKAAESGDYLTQLSAHKSLRELLKEDSAASGLQPLRLAVLGSSTTAQLIPLLELHCFKEGLLAEIYESPFDQYQQEILDPSSRLYAFRPQAALLFVNYRDVRPGPTQVEAERWVSLWRTLSEKGRCFVIANNFDLPVERPAGSLEGGLDQGVGRLRRLNALLAERTGQGVALLDAEHLSAMLGKERWHDPRFWHHSRQAVSFEGLTRYAAEAAAMLRAALGRSRKCLVVDLDNVLWGGIVGEDGVAALELGDTPRGDAFLEFQRYLKALKQRGVLLAACSKNDEANAKEPFAKRPEMPLRLDDFSAFVANWEDKATNLRSIASSLNIGLDALVFVDDSAAECEIVRRFCPEVAVLQMPEDPAEYCRLLDSRRFFETVSISGEDASRAAHFEAEKSRRALESAAPDLKSFLRDLRMRATAEPFKEEDLGRIAQLINKTNQFNLTARRRNEAELRALIKDPSALTLSVRLQDRLGDYGLIAVCIGLKRGEEVEIDSWLMSCRALGRGVEQFTFTRLAQAAWEAGAKSLLGRYLPTPKNGMVRDLYPSLGFKREGERWRLELPAPPAEAFISDGSAIAAS